MDVLFVDGVYFEHKIHLNKGLMILDKIVSSEYKSKHINFDLLNRNGIIKYSLNYDENIEIMVDYLLSKQPKIVGFYTICNCFITSIKIGQLLKKRNPEIIIPLK